MPIEDLRLLTLDHWGYDGAEHQGELVVHADHAAGILNVFHALFDARFPIERMQLVDVYGADGLPFNTRFGNGDAIGADVVQVINEVYEANTLREPWQAGDLLLVDNVRTAHSREPFEGPREVLVAMADPVRLADCSPTVEVTA